MLRKKSSRASILRLPPIPSFTFAVRKIDLFLKRVPVSCMLVTGLHFSIFFPS